MYREPASKGPGLLFRFRKNGTKRALLLVLHNTPATAPQIATDTIRRIMEEHEQWQVEPHAVQDAVTV
jgi:hypothetical protein